MHIGRNHHALLSVLGGLVTSFVAFSFATMRTTSQYSGQLMAGDQAANRAFPTTLNTMQSAMDGTNPLLQAMSSYGWWVLVIVGGLVAAPILFRLTRRFV